MKTRASVLISREWEFVVHTEVPFKVLSRCIGGVWYLQIAGTNTIKIWRVPKYLHQCKKRQPKLMRFSANSEATLLSEIRYI
jgi:hypothetical protein